jgi:hypothetical protein
MKHFATFCALLLSFSMFACQDCSMETESVRSVRLGFFKLGTDGKTYIPFDTAIAKIYGFGNEEKLLYPKEGETGTVKRKIFELPLNIYDKGTAFVFENSGKKDTIAFLHKQRYEVYTPDCGYAVQIYDFEVFKSPYPKYKILSKTLTSTNIYDIEIYP